MKILPYEATHKIVSNITFIQAGFERFAQEDIVKLTYEPQSNYHKSYIENVVTLQIRYRTEYPSEESKETMQHFAEEDERDAE